MQPDKPISDNLRLIAMAKKGLKQFIFAPNKFY
jgi:hypothetical protein